MNKILGVDIGGTDIKLGIVSEDGSILESGVIPTLAPEGPEKAALRVRDWLEGKSGAHGEISCAGIDCAGLIDGSKGYLYYSPNLPGWTDLDLGSLFSEVLGLRVTVDNDVNAAAWGEYVLGAGRGTEYFVCLTLGTGIGGGVIAAGRLYRGWQGMAGEIGHQVIDRAGPECKCGSKGCLEAMASAGSIVARVREALSSGSPSSLGDPDGLTAKSIAEAAAGGDGVSLEALAAAGGALGIGLANVVHLFNPEVIAVGGGVAGAGELILGPARESMREHLMDDILAGVRVVTAELGNTASLTGAAMMAMEGRD